MDPIKFKNKVVTASGWHYDYQFLQKISDITSGRGYPIGMKEVESVIMALEERFNDNK